jgi:hypothetical protein
MFCLGRGAGFFCGRLAAEEIPGARSLHHHKKRNGRDDDCKWELLFH